MALAITITCTSWRDSDGVTDLGYGAYMKMHRRHPPCSAGPDHLFAILFTGSLRQQISIDMVRDRIHWQAAWAKCWILYVTCRLRACCVPAACLNKRWRAHQIVAWYILKKRERCSITSNMQLPGASKCVTSKSMALTTCNPGTCSGPSSGTVSYPFKVASLNILKNEMNLAVLSYDRWYLESSYSMIYFANIYNVTTRGYNTQNTWIWNTKLNGIFSEVTQVFS